MGVKNRVTVKGHFETGDIPTQGQYVDFIDSTVFKNPGGSLQIISGEVSASSLVSETHITASGNISASGNFTGVSASLSMITASGNITAFGGTGSFGRLNITDFGNIFASGHITASGNISSSGTHTVSTLNSTNISATGHITASGRLQTLSHITASGNISSSGELFAKNATFSDLTSGRVTFTTTDGKLTDDGDLTFSDETLTTTTLNATNISASNISASGYLTSSLMVGAPTGSFQYIETDKVFQHKGDPNSGIFFANDVLSIKSNNVKTFMSRTTAGVLLGHDTYPTSISGSTIQLNAPVTASSHISASGDLTVTGTIYPGGGGLWASPPVVLNDEDTVLSHNIHAGRTLIIRDTGGNRTYSLKVAAAPFGQPYHFIYGGATGDAQTTVIDTDANDNSIFFRGSINHISTQDDISTTAVFSDGDSNSRLTLNTIQACDIHILAYSATIWYVWGSVTSEEAPTFSNQ
tara:strand:+ start:1361 stop:2764 length:1404 start_codon:yes stop_codon:yes gene_type:complete